MQDATCFGSVVAPRSYDFSVYEKKKVLAEMNSSASVTAVLFTQGPVTIWSTWTSQQCVEIIGFITSESGY